MPSGKDIKSGVLNAGIGQVPLTLINSVVSVVFSLQFCIDHRLKSSQFPKSTGGPLGYSLELLISPHVTSVQRPCALAVEGCVAAKLSIRDQCAIGIKPYPIRPFQTYTRFSIQLLSCINTRITVFFQT